MISCHLQGLESQYRTLSSYVSMVDLFPELHVNTAGLSLGMTSRMFCDSNISASGIFVLSVIWITSNSLGYLTSNK